MKKDLTIEEVRKKYYEDKIFNELKDIYFMGGTKYIKSRYGKYGIDATGVYRRIVNYRIKKYGTSSLIDPDSGVLKTTMECYRDASRASSRHRQRIHGR